MAMQRRRDPRGCPLDLDIGLVRMSLAALKAQAEMAPTDEEVNIAKRLADHYRTEAELLSASHQISPSAVPERRLRKDLEQVFALLAPSRSPSQAGQEDLFQRIAKLLEQFGSERRLSRGRLQELIDALDELSRRDFEDVTAPKFDLDVS